VTAPFAGARSLITGGAGFIGSHLARRLVDLGSEVTVLDSFVPESGSNPANLGDVRLRMVIGDVRDEQAVREVIAGQQFIFNLAGQTGHMDSMRDPVLDLEVNSRAQLGLVEACRQHNPDVKLVFASTRQVYGRPRYLPVDERHPTRPVDVNGINKLSGESYHLLYNDVYGVRATVLRLTNTYGPHMRIKDARQTFLGIWVRLVLEGKPFEVWGGEQTRDFTYVDDAVDASRWSHCGTLPIWL
jgi:UDP-glucose 4-epimerase